MFDRRNYETFTIHKIKLHHKDSNSSNSTTYLSDTGHYIHQWIKIIQPEYEKFKIFQYLIG